MNDIQEPDKCKHSKCVCTTDGSDFCSNHCETAAGGSPESGCQCGHAECTE